MTTVMAFGTFDGIHKGHEYYLKKAKSFWNKLVVVVARDATVKKIKNKLPSNNEQQRLQKVIDLAIADKVIIGNSGDKLKVVEEFKPDIICLGYDQNSFTHSLKGELKKRDINAKIIRLDAFKPGLYKSSLIKKQTS
jgi:FAD synthetase